MLKSQLISVCLLWGLVLPAFAGASVLLPFSDDVTLDRIEQTDLYAKADDGYADAQFQLACFYQKQKKKDYQTIVMWLTKSANQGYLEAQFALGRIYQYGKPGVLPDPELSEKYYEMAAEKGDKEALRALAYLRRSPSYKIKSAPDIDEKWDMEWLAKTAGYGDSISQYELGRLFEEGAKVPRNYEKALYWYERAANQNRLEAMCAAAYMYLDGKGTQVNVDKAVDWYEKAAMQDYTPAQRKLYEIYSSDQDKIPDLVKAYQWLYLAMTFMFPDSKNVSENAPELAELEKRLSVDQKQQAMDFVEKFIKERRPYALSK